VKEAGMTNRILVVDDEKPVRDILFRALTRIGGFEVEVAESAENALPKIEREDFGLVLVDLVLPKMGGLDLISEIVACKPDILVMVMTGYATVDSALEAMKRGASDYLKKPIDMEEMIIRVRRALDERSRFVRLKEVAENLETVNRELTRLDGVKSEFVALASHELRTPLTVMKSQIQLIRQGKLGPINEDQTESLTMAEDNINRLIKLVKDLLDLSKIQCGKIEMRFEEIDLAALAAYVLALFSAEAELKSIRLTNEIPETGLCVMADREKVERILINLIGNAIKFTPEGGQISILSAPPQEGEKEYVISIKDSGIGIPREQFHRIFEKFQQGDGEKYRSASGTGLGLAITKGLVEAHQGRIWVESEIGKGSIFKFTLPRPCP
jgi:two-component system, sensor histidine kinase and response regulator